MSFKDLGLQYSYSSAKNNLVIDFYNPVLSKAIKYDRIAGYFNSSSLAIAARGIKDFIINNGKMRLLCGVNLNKEDLNAIVDTSDLEDRISNKFLKDIDNIENKFVENHVKLLGWMVANNLLEIKIGVNKNDGEDVGGILHSKYGIMWDPEGNCLGFNGSNNETASGWSRNIEKFKVFFGWENSNFYLEDDIAEFSEFWNNENEYLEVVDVPHAAKEGLIKFAPKSWWELDNLALTEFDSEFISSKIKLYDYQNEAINNWFNNSKRGIFQMATGTGKTFTALGALKRLTKEKEKLITIISVPNLHLVPQWIKSIKSFGIWTSFDSIIEVSSAKYKSKEKMYDALLDLDLDYKNQILIFTTHDTLSNKKFIENIEEFNKFDSCLIADEMHGLGSFKRRLGLIESYNYRLGLSATPERNFDDFGTEFLFDYFGDVVYEFSLGKALNSINPATGLSYLTPFNYHPYFVNLSSEEMDKYNHFSKLIGIEMGKSHKNLKKIEMLLIKRANIIKNAVNKYDVLKEILEDIDEKSGLIIYCSDEQIDKVVDIAGNKFNLSVRTFTSKDSATPQKDKSGKSERDIILEDFGNGLYEVLVAMHCLDEGVDVPAVSKAILMCSSTSTRELIQRVGRVIRRHENKTFAEIYDLLIKPSKWDVVTETNLFGKEFNRAKKIVDLSNDSEAYIKLSEVYK